jgi:archaellum biogenesis ATPase FlaH
MFVEALGRGSKGYCVTRDYPLKIRSKYNLGETTIIWLSNIGKEDSLRPKDLEKLSFSLEQFLSKNQGGVILLDGLEYLITNNNFLTVLRFLQTLRDQVAINHSILLMAVNPSTLDPHELNLLEREVDVTI